MFSSSGGSSSSSSSGSGSGVQWCNNIMYVHTYVLIYFLLEPSAPLSVRAVSTGLTSILVSWVPPSEPNGVIIGYTVIVSPLHGSGSPINIDDGSVTSINITGLLPAIEYAITVQALNGAGSGDPGMDNATTEATSKKTSFILCT